MATRLVHPIRSSGRRGWRGPVSDARVLAGRPEGWRGWGLVDGGAELEDGGELRIEGRRGAPAAGRGDGEKS